MKRLIIRPVRTGGFAITVKDGREVLFATYVDCVKMAFMRDWRKHGAEGFMQTMKENNPIYWRPKTD